MSHDQNFKDLILDYTHQAIALFAASEAHAIDTQVRVTPVRQEQLQERLGRHYRALDTPVLAEWPDGWMDGRLWAGGRWLDGRRQASFRLPNRLIPNPKGACSDSAANNRSVASAFTPLRHHQF